MLVYVWSSYTKLLGILSIKKVQTDSYHKLWIGFLLHCIWPTTKQTIRIRMVILFLQFFCSIRSASSRLNCVPNAVRRPIHSSTKSSKNAVHSWIHKTHKLTHIETETHYTAMSLYLPRNVNMFFRLGRMKYARHMCTATDEDYCAIGMSKVDVHMIWFRWKIYILFWIFPFRIPIRARNLILHTRFGMYSARVNRAPCDPHRA